MSAADPYRFIADGRIDVAGVFAAYEDLPAIIRLSGHGAGQGSGHGAAHCGSGLEFEPCFTYGDVFHILHALDSALRRRGVGPGSRVALYADNGPLHYFLFFLAWIRGDVFMPLDFQSPPERVLSPVDAGFGTCSGMQARTDDCADPGSRAFIVQKKDLGSDADPLADAGASAGPNKGRHRDRDRGRGREALILLDADDLIHEVLDIRKKDAPGPESIRPAIPPAALDRECSLVFTSGSTGRPLGVFHTVGNHVYSAAGVISFFALEPQNRWLVSLPLNHVGGLSIFTRMFLSGGAVVFPKSRRDVESTLRKHAADCVSVVPTQLIRFISSDQTAKALASMQLVLLGGAACPEWAIARALDRGIPVVPSYGSTESCSLVTAVAPGSPRAAYCTSGKVLPHRALSTDPAGRIRLSGETRFSSCTDGNRRIRPFEDGWFITSDLGSEDENGNWRIHGRADEVFISGGENINPFEIEQSICAIDGIDTAVVVPAPHESFGVVPWAFVAGHNLPGPETIAAHLRQSLPGFMVPKRILFMEPGEAAKGIKVDRAYLKKKAVDMAGKAGL